MLFTSSCMCIRTLFHYHAESRTQHEHQRFPLTLINFLAYVPSVMYQILFLEHSSRLFSYMVIEVVSIKVVCSLSNIWGHFFLLMVLILLKSFWGLVWNLLINRFCSNVFVMECFLIFLFMKLC